MLRHLRNSLNWVLLPHGDVWQSQRYRAVADTLDKWSFWCTMSNNLLIFRAYSRSEWKLRWPLFWRWSPLFVWIPCAVAQQAWRARWPESYFRNRHLVLLWSRTVRLLSAIYFHQNFRNRLMSTGLFPEHKIYDARTDLPRPLGAFGFGMLVSGAIHPILHGTHTPLPFVSQLLYQAVYFVVLVISSARTAAGVLQRSHYSPEILGFCRHLNSLAAIGLGGMGVISDVEFLDRECHAHAWLLLVLFAYLYIGFALPVYMAYRLEQHLQQQLQQEARQQQQQQEGQPEPQHQQQPQEAEDELRAVDFGDDGAVSVPGTDVLALLFMAVSCWGLVLMLHAPLVDVIWPDVADWLP